MVYTIIIIRYEVIDMEIGEKLYYWRSRKDISIYNLSKISGISEGHIRNLENGKKQPTFKAKPHKPLKSSKKNGII